jgi:hypothetical protein
MSSNKKIRPLPPKKVKPVGRPSDYKPEYCQALIDHMAKVHSFESFAATIGTCRKTIYNWCNEHPDFLHARKIGREMAQIGLENIGKAIMTGKVKGNPAVWIFFMKNMTNWRDDHAPEIEEIDGIEFV